MAETIADNNTENPNKNFLLTVALSYFVGSLGVDRFYLGYTGTAIIKLLTFGGLGIWSLIDFLRICIGSLKAKGDKRPLETYAQYARPFKYIGWALFAVNIISFLVFAGAFGWVTYQGIQERADNLTNDRAAFAAENINSYIVNNNALPESFSQFIPDADISNLTYHKDNENSYTFCATYKKDNSQLQTVTPDELPANVYTDNQALYISHKHTAGQNCRKIIVPLQTSSAAAPAPVPVVAPPSAKTYADNGCGVVGLMNDAGHSGNATDITRSSQLVNGVAPLTLRLPARNGGTVYSVGADAKVFNAQCVAVDHSKIASGDSVTIFLSAQDAAGTHITGETLKASVVIDRTAH